MPGTSPFEGLQTVFPSGTAARATRPACVGALVPALARKRTFAADNHGKRQWAKKGRSRTVGEQVKSTRSGRTMRFPQRSAWHRLRPSALRKYRSFADGSAKWRNRPKAEISSPHQRRETIQPQNRRSGRPRERSSGTPSNSTPSLPQRCPLESVREHHAGLHSFRSMRRMEARRRKARALWLRHSQSLASRRQRPSQAKVRSTIQRLGSATKPVV